MLLGVPGDGVAPASGKGLKAIHAAEQRIRQASSSND